MVDQSESACLFKAIFQCIHSSVHPSTCQLLWVNKGESSPDIFFPNNLPQLFLSSHVPAHSMFWNNPAISSESVMPAVQGGTLACSFPLTIMLTIRSSCSFYSSFPVEGPFLDSCRLRYWRTSSQHLLFNSMLISLASQHLWLQGKHGLKSSLKAIFSHDIMYVSSFWTAMITSTFLLQTTAPWTYNKGKNRSETEMFLDRKTRHFQQYQRNIWPKNLSASSNINTIFK